MLAALIALVLAAVVVVECARTIDRFRRTALLNRAMHELRRPLQSISLSIEGESPDLSCAGACLEQARSALDDLDAVVNRRPLDLRVMRTELEEIASALDERWRFAGVEVDSIGPGRALDVDPARVGAALDNLVANAIEHGGGRVRVQAVSGPGSVRFEVRDDGPADGERPPAADRRRGHGLGVTAELASDHGGTVLPPRRTAGGGTMAALSLPAPRALPSGPR